MKSGETRPGRSYNPDCMGSEIAYFVGGFALGAILAATALLVAWRIHRSAASNQMREAFSAMAAEALDANTQRLSLQAAGVLDGKKELIDQSVKDVRERLEQVRRLLSQAEGERKTELGKLGTAVSSLSTTTGDLHKMLASTQRRGAWGERMAEDVLRLAGMQEGINYTKQSSDQVESGRPDFTFSLPNDMKANMDVKFPLDHYKAYVDADSDAAGDTALKQLVAAVRGHIRDVARRGYIDPSVPTVPYVIVFIPAEHIYSLVLEAQPDLMDEALKSKVVLASPLTLYAMLALMRQAAEGANVEKAADEVMTLLSQFYKQWDEYNRQVDTLGKRIESVASQFDVVSTTRSNQLRKPLERIEQIRNARGLPDQ